MMEEDERDHIEEGDFVELLTTCIEEASVGVFFGLFFGLDWLMRRCLHYGVGKKKQRNLSNNNYKRATEAA